MSRSRGGESVVFWLFAFSLAFSSSLATAVAPTKSKSKTSKAKTTSATELNDTEAGNTAETHARNEAFANDFRSPWAMNMGFSIYGLANGDHVYSLQNPALAVRAKRLVATGVVAQQNNKSVAKSSSFKGEFEFNFLSMGALVAGSLTPQVFVGLAAGQNQGELKGKGESTSSSTPDSASSKDKYTITDITPFFAVAIGKNLGVGAEYSSVTQEIKSVANASGSSGEKSKQAFNILRPGIVYQNRNMQLGFRYAPPINIVDEDGSAVMRRQLRFHGQFILGGGGSVGGTITHYYNHGIDGGDKDGVVAVLGGDTLTGFGTWGLFLLYESALYRDKEDVNAFNTDHYGLSTNAGFTLAKNATLQPTLAYKTGSDKSKAGDSLSEDTKFDDTSFEVGLQMQYVF